MTCRFPHVIALRISLLLDQVLQLSFPSMTSVAPDGLDFILFFIIHKVQRWARIVFAMFYCFDVWGKEVMHGR